MSQSKSYTGGCHCGAVRFQVNADLSQVVDCNCSICGRAGWILTFVPAEQFTLQSGEDALTDYQFGKKNIHHTFCKVCGVRSFSKGKTAAGKETRAINVRCLDDVDLASLSVTHFDGKKL